MKNIVLAAAMAAAVPGFAAAQAGSDPADLAAAAPPPAYRSAFEDLPKGLEEGQVDWRQANADVAQFPRGHADYLKWEEQQPAASQPAASPAPPPAAPATPRPHGHMHH